MASPVPYTGVPDVSPQVNPISPVHVDTPVAAFGGAVAGAIQNAGQVTQSVGKELFARANAMQELNNQDTVNQATADYQNAVTQKFVDLTKNQGQDAIHALPGFMQETEQMRQDAADKLTNPQSKFLFNQESRQARFRVVFSAGNYAREEMKKYSTESQTLKSDAVSNNLATTGVTSGPQFDQGMDEIRQQGGRFVEEKYGIHPGDPEYQPAVDAWLSPHAAKIAMQASKNDPAKGKALFDSMTKSGLIQPKDGIAIAPQINSAVETRDARETAHNVASGDPAHWGDEPYSTPVAVEGLKAAGTGSYSTVGKDASDGSHPVGKYGPNSKLLAAELPKAGLVNESGGKVTTEADFLNSPKAQDDFAKAVFPRLQDENKTFKGAFNAWTGSDNPTQLNSALNAVAKNSDPKTVRDKAREAMAQRAPNSPIAQDNAAEIAENTQSRSRQVDVLSAQRDRNTVIGMINGDNTLDGRVPQSLDEALQNPKFADSYHSLPAEDQLAVTKILRQNSELGGVRENSVGFAEYQRLKSIMINRDTTSTPKELEEAAYKNLIQLPFSPAHRSELMGLQHKTMQGLEANPNMTHAMGLPAVQKLMSDAGIDKKSNPDEYQKFTNSYHDALVGYGTGAERSVKQDDEFTNVAKGLISTHANTWMGWARGETQPYSDMMSTSPKMRKQGEALFLKTYGRSMVPDEPQDTENANRLLLRAIYNQLGTTAAPAQPKSTAKVQP